MGKEFIYTGVDKDSKVIKVAKKMFVSFKEAQFHVGDVSKPRVLQMFLQKENSINMAVFQHLYLLDGEPEVKQNFIDMITKVLPKYLTPHAVLYASVYYLEEKKVLEGLKMKGLPVFAPGMCRTIEHSDESSIKVEGRTVIPEHYVFATCLSSPKLQRAKEGGLCSCNGLFKVAVVGTAAVAAAYLAYVHNETPTLGS